MVTILLVGLVSIAATLVATIVLLNATLGKRGVPEPLDGFPAVGDPGFARGISVLLPRPLVAGNQVVALRNGDEIFPAMLDAIRDATMSLTLETYIYWSGETGDEFSKAIAMAARRGCATKILLDWVGGDLHAAQLRAMRDAGVQIHRYNPPRWTHLGHMNNRTHRKLMVADGRVGFIGGVGLADAWRGHAQDPQHWRDTHFRVEGPVVAQLQSAFVDNWLQASGELLHGRRFFDAGTESRGSADAQVFTSSPQGGARDMRLLYLMSIAGAVRTLDLSASYFLPDAVSIDALRAAARRGVRVRILVPGAHIDMAFVRWASRAGWGPLLEAGVEIHEYVPTMFHCKVLIADRVWVSVGSTNFDTRSFDINDEANLNVRDAAFALRQTGIFEEDLTRARPVTLETWRGRSPGSKALDALARVFASQL